MTACLTVSGWVFGAIVAVIDLIACYVICRKSERKYEEGTFTPRKGDRNGEYILYETPGDDVVDYEPRHGHYLKTAEVIVTLASASLLFLPSAHMSGVPLAKFGFSIVLLASCVMSGVLFMALVTYFYEDFLYDPRSFTLNRSAWLSALGLMELTYFGLRAVFISAPRLKHPR